MVLGYLGLSQGNGSVRQDGTYGQQFIGNPCQAEICDFENAVLGDEQVARLDVAMTLQPLSQGVFHAHAKLVAKLQRPSQVQPRCTDPATQIAPLNELKQHVKASFDHFNRVRPDDIRMIAELDPDPAFRGETADPGTTAQ